MALPCVKVLEKGLKCTVLRVEMGIVRRRIVRKGYIRTSKRETGVGATEDEREIVSIHSIRGVEVSVVKGGIETTHMEGHLRRRVAEGRVGAIVIKGCITVLKVEGTIVTMVEDLRIVTSVSEGRIGVTGRRSWRISWPKGRTKGQINEREDGGG